MGRAELWLGVAWLATILLSVGCWTVVSLSRGKREDDRTRALHDFADAQRQVAAAQQNATAAVDSHAAAIMAATEGEHRGE